MRAIELAGRTLHIVEALEWENEAGAVLWDAGLVLLHFIAAHPTLVVGKRVIELGAGTGAVGCTAAVLGATVTLTDLPAVVPLAARNIEANGLGGSATAAPLTWGVPVSQQLPGEPPFDLVLASDVLYQADALPLFVATVSELLAANPAAQLLLCNERRERLPFPEALFRTAGLSVHVVPAEEQHPHWRCEDIQLWRISQQAGQA